MRAAPISLLLLAACAQPDLDVPGEAAAQRAETPALLPFEAILAPPPVPTEDPAAFSADLDARATDLRTRAAALPPPDPAARPALEDRLGALRDRAEDVRAREDATAGQAERDRLDRLRERTRP